MSGVRGGVAYPVRYMDDVLSWFGITDGWATHMDELQQTLHDKLGTTGANLLMNGIGGALGMYWGHRGGISDPLELSYLLENFHKDPEADWLKWMAGMPAGTAQHFISAVDAMRNGDPMGFMTNLLPRVIGDPIKAYGQWMHGVTTGKGKPISPPVSLPQSMWKGLGGTNITERNAHEASAAGWRDYDQEKNDRSNVYSYVHKGDMAGAQSAMRKFNQAHPNSPMNQGDLLRAKNSTKSDVLGVPTTKKNRPDLLGRSRAYGLAPQ
jgi:hypothetical protein